MKIIFTNFYTEDNYQNLTIVIAVSIIFLIIIFRYWSLKKITKTKIIAIQAPELRNKFIITRDQYHLQIWKQWSENSEIIIVGIHGLQGTKTDFKALKAYCLHQKWSLLTFDRRINDSNLPYKHFKTFATDIDDTKDVILALKAKYPHHKIILFGEAIGASIAVFATKNNPHVSSLITSNLITRKNLFPFSLKLKLIILFGFIFKSNINLPVTIDPTTISSNITYINKIKQNIAKKKIWSLRFSQQLKTLNKKSTRLITKIKQPVLILQSADDIFSDFHNLKVLKTKWWQKQQYYFHFSGKHALINEPEMTIIFTKIIINWVVKEIIN